MSTSHPHNIRFCWPRDLDAHASVRGRDSGSSVGLKAKLPLGHFVFLMPLNQQINKAAALWDGETAHDHKGKLGCGLTVMSCCDTVLSPGCSWEQLLVPQCPIVKFNGNYTNQIKVGPLISRIKVWVISLGKELRLVKCLTEEKGNTACRMVSGKEW